MNTSSKNQLLVKIAIFLFVIITIITVLYWTLPQDKTPRLSGYVSMIGILGVALGVIGFFLSQQAQIRATEESNLQSAMNLIQSNYIQLERELSNDPDLLSMYQNMNRGNPLTDNLTLQLQNESNTNTTIAGFKRARIVAWVIQIIENTDSLVRSRGISWNDPRAMIYLKLYQQWFKNEPDFEKGWKGYLEQFSDVETRNLINNRIIE